MRQNCPQISVRIHVEFWLGLDARKIHMPKTKVEISIEDLASNMFNSRSYKFRTVGVELARAPTNLFIEHSPQTYPTVPSSFNRVISLDKVH